MTGCAQAKIVLTCLAVQAVVIVFVTGFLSLVPDWFMGVQNFLAITTTGLGFVCAVTSLRTSGAVNRSIGTVGLLWFGFVLMMFAGAFG